MESLVDKLKELKASRSDSQYRLLQNEFHKLSYNDDESNLIDRFCELFGNCEQQHEGLVIRLLIIICVVS